MNGSKILKFAHCVVIGHTTEKIKIRHHFVIEMYYNQKKWCEENFGTQGNRWDYSFDGEFYFRDGQDATLFALRWT